MRTTLGIVLIVMGIFTSIMVPSDQTVAITGAKGDLHRRAVVHGLHVARPADMKMFPVEIVALP
jgi:hypothetical protein